MFATKLLTPRILYTSEFLLMHKSQVLLLAEKAGHFREVKPCTLGYTPLFLKSLSYGIQNMYNVNCISFNVPRMTPHSLTKCALYMSPHSPLSPLQPTVNLINKILLRERIPVLAGLGHHQWNLSLGDISRPFHESHEEALRQMPANMTVKWPSAWIVGIELNNDVPKR
jgi:hypothetical protein